MRILMLTQWFDPEPTLKGITFAKGLIRRGHEVEVLTGFPNYPGGKIYNGYRIKPCQINTIERIRVNRVALYPSHNNSGVQRILNYLSFSLTSLFLGTWLVRKPDVVIVYNLITLAWTAAFLRWLYGCKIVYDVQDLWPESVVFSGMLNNSLALRFLKNICNRAYRKADFIVAQSPGFKQNLSERGISDTKIKVIYNWCEEEFYKDQPSYNKLEHSPELKDSFNVMFAGTMGVMQGIDTILDAALICTEKIPNVRFILVGDGIETDRLLERKKNLELDNVIFLPRQPIEEMGKIFTLADALIVHLKRHNFFTITIPSKTQAYLEAGLPILMAMEGDSAKLVRQAGAGVTCQSEDAHAMAKCIEKLHNMTPKERTVLGKNGVDFYKKTLSFQHGVGEFVSVFKSIVSA